MLVVNGAAQERLPFPRRDDWRIDARTRAAARRGLADARAALERSQRRHVPCGAHKARGGER
ncbi:MAG TPA: hypothetical protein VFA84_15980 [Acidimicrobiales bacterium]|nr:hypothetical protein [Acidimicrobiales bacterium]